MVTKVQTSTGHYLHIELWKRAGKKMRPPGLASGDLCVDRECCVLVSTSEIILLCIYLLHLYCIPQQGPLHPWPTLITIIFA